jgi:hypothetical protein
MAKVNRECWAMKDTERDILVSSKWGRSLWNKKPNPKNINFIGYRKFERGDHMLKPVRVIIKEVE